MNMKRKLILKRLIFAVILSIIPVLILINNFYKDTGFMPLIHFGAQFKPGMLPEIKMLNPPVLSEEGYDGQFYSQMAVRPDITDQHLHAALDYPMYRIRRIGMPFLAHAIGWGNPWLVLQTYALLNVAFWLLLLGGFYLFIVPTRFKDFLLMASILWTTGTLISLSKALTDFPALVLCVLAVWVSRRWVVASSLFGIVGLFKETSLLSMISLIWPQQENELVSKRIFLSAVIICLPFGLWYLYIKFSFPLTTVHGLENFGLPFLEVAKRIHSSWGELFQGFSGAPKVIKGFLLFEALCPLSLMVQTIYLFYKFRPSSKTWRMGIAFAVLSLCLSWLQWREQPGYTRVLLPLTAAFNLLIHEHEGRWSFYIWYALGNVGMAWMLLVTLI